MNINVLEVRRKVRERLEKGFRVQGTGSGVVSNELGIERERSEARVIELLCELFKNPDLVRDKFRLVPAGNRLKIMSQAHIYYGTLIKGKIYELQEPLRCIIYKRDEYKELREYINR